MKTAREILEPYIERPFRHTEIVEKDAAIKAMEDYASQFIKTDITEEELEDYCNIELKKYSGLTLKSSLFEIGNSLKKMYLAGAKTVLNYRK